ncbi:carboxypeptidase regulatory-like domain-containing protein [Candidatus Woesearchaeota archaeon]|nr:carboxypeptidase regulatory-like domain-containing protein [Candidatus Woesearchaeota archaeon]
MASAFIMPVAYSQDCNIQGHCGDGACNGDDTCSNCPQDCGSCCVGNVGSSCNCGACGCGGTIQCGGGCSGGDPTPGNYNQPCGSCGRGRINCAGQCSGDYSNCGSAGWYNTGSGCGNCGTQQQYCNGCDWAGSYQCINQGPCSPGSAQCVSNRYQTCSSSCQWQNSGTNSDNDGKDLQCGDSICDNSPNVYDDTRTPQENACSDSLDNDCDIKTDCNDNDCDGSITGNVKNQQGQPVSSADISAKKDLTTIKSSTTNSQGNYNIAPIACGTYNLVASHPDYAPQAKNNIPVNPQQLTTSNFGGEESGSSLILGTSCEPDCTFASDDIIHSSCDGKNGCAFFDSISKAACDNSQTGWLRDYNSTHYIACASGSPQPKIEIAASVSCESGTLVKVTSIVIYNGKPVKLVVAVCG